MTGSSGRMRPPTHDSHGPPWTPPSTHHSAWAVVPLRGSSALHAMLLITLLRSVLLLAATRYRHWLLIIPPLLWARTKPWLEKLPLAVGVTREFASHGTVAVAYYQAPVSTPTSVPPAMKTIEPRIVKPLQRILSLSARQSNPSPQADSDLFDLSWLSTVVLLVLC